MSADTAIAVFAAIFTGAALLATATLFARQSLLVAYIALGIILGPWGVGVVNDAETITQIGSIGIIFLLFLLGLNLHPQKLLKMLREATLVTVVSGASCGVVSAALAAVFGFSPVEAIVIGAAMMFSSTILGLKLMPTTALHHRHAGEAVISILLLQDLIAIVVLLILEGARTGGSVLERGALVVVGLPLLIAGAWFVERYVIDKLVSRFDTIREYVFVLAIGWCLGLAQLAHFSGLSYEVGAFIAGVALASSPISFFISESLRPLRDFFLIMFFFALGASLDLAMVWRVIVPATVIACVMLVAKPLLFRALLQRAGETPELATEVGVRLGQNSEFALLISVVALQAGVISADAGTVIQSAAVISIIVSSYLIMLKYPTPIAVSDKLRRD